MTLRLDPRRLRALKDLAGEAGLRPGDLARQWVEERIDAARMGAGAVSLGDRLAAIEERIAALEGAAGSTAAESAVRAEPTGGGPEAGEQATDADPEREELTGAEPMSVTTPDRPAPEAVASDASATEARSEAPQARTRRRGRVSAAPAPKVALHDEMIAVLGERGPMAAGDLAAAIIERGRYAPPRSGKALDAAMVSQRASNPTYRSRFVRREGKIGLAESA